MTDETTTALKPPDPALVALGAAELLPGRRYLMNLHEVLSVARMNRVGEPADQAMIAGCYRCEADYKAEAERICERNGASLSEYLRGCIRTLVLEYR